MQHKKKDCKHNIEIKIFRYYKTFDVYVIDIKKNTTAYFYDEDLFDSSEPDHVTATCSTCGKIWKAKKLSDLPEFIQEIYLNAKD